MCLAVHPSLEKDGTFCFVCDNYLIGEHGVGPCLHATPKKVFII